MHIACYKNNYEMVYILLKSYPLIDKTDKMGFTPLYYSLINKNYKIATVYTKLFSYYYIIMLVRGQYHLIKY